MTDADMGAWEEAGGKAIFHARSSMADGPLLDAAWNGITEAARARYRNEARRVIACRPHQPARAAEQGVLAI